ncbi:probable 2-oxoglutarate-dependent dioxygenase AOP1.2 [Actinidia eriantha]|uniref:probable 2-oxoglutarate-dependent dioxygenase AOP1.2 n=1 Tax=Actinidia eriantha TaxID=165200 RepID=UPI002587E518|nr:probable 2-oxoglutarate-dependent dioxygenase AOP1.2 [Actinidia eriantha]
MGIDDANTMEGMQKFEKVMWPNGNDGFSDTFVLKVNSRVGAMGGEDEIPKRRSNMRFVAHTDKNFMTILHQNQVDSLEIKAKDSQWFGVELCPSSFVVMAGNAIMAWSNGRVHSPHHRVTMNGNKARYSLGQFSFMKGTVKSENTGGASR